MLLALLASLHGVSAQVTATGTMGTTNPPAPSFYAVGSTVNQLSDSRLISANSVDDFCIFAPESYGDTIGDDEATVVAYCTQPRNGARLIPDGAITSAHFIKTPLYVQVYGLWDGTKVNIKAGDEGGELDPHGATGDGNPVGGNVTSNVSGKDVSYQEWMNYVAVDSFCLRICTAENATVSAAIQCQHTLDKMGCEYVMAIPDLYNSQYAFTECDGDAAYGPGLYPEANGSTSTFAQRYTGSYTQSSTIDFFTVGVTVTPTAPAFFPATSNCLAYSTISNGININNPVVNSQPGSLTGGSSYGAQAPVQPTSNSSSSSTSMTTTSASTSTSKSTAPASTPSAGSGSGSASASPSATAAAKSDGSAISVSSVLLFAGVILTAVF